ncbi:peptide ABC transporter permease [Clostridia bacterium]|nr:peptide ABC transporter permease [Clostridia bacterium]
MRNSTVPTLTGSRRMRRKSPAWHSLSVFMRVMLHNRQAFFGMIILLGFLFMATAGPSLIALDGRGDFASRFAPISARHPLGTDNVGRDLFSQLVHGSRDVLFIGAVAACFTVLIGFTVGAVAGFAGGAVDSMLMAVTNLFLTIPYFPVMIVLTAIIKGSSNIILAIMVASFGWAGLARAIRAQILSMKQRDYIVVCKTMDMGYAHIVFKEMLPNLTSYLAINFIGSMQGAINASSGLILLGFAPYKTTHWMAMLNSAIIACSGTLQPKMLLFLFVPIVAFGLLQMGCIFFAHGLDEAMNPRLR